jgi:hypothetical protein
VIKSRWGTEPGSHPPPPGQSGSQSQIRNSNGLEQFFFTLQGRENLSILDLSCACQDNITFITNLGHRIYTEGVLDSIDEVFGADPEMQSNPVRIDMFLKQVLEFPENHFDGALVWDILQFLSPAAAQAAVDCLHRVLRPRSYVLCFFNANEKARSVPAFNYRIRESKTLLLSPRGSRATNQFFNNRAIEKLFHKYESVKFFLTRDHLREVIVKK